MKKRVPLLLGLFLIGMVATFVWFAVRAWNIRKSPHAISSSGGALFDLRLPDRGTYFLQTDPAWRNDPIGGASGETLGNVGCTLCSVANGLTILGLPIDPPTLNARLQKLGGYTTNGWIIWSSVRAATDGFAEVVVHSRPSYAEIDVSLQRGEVPLVKIFLPGAIQHWVAIVGKEGDGYVVKDPLVSSRKVVRLSTRGPKIHSLRVLRRR